MISLWQPYHTEQSEAICKNGLRARLYLPAENLKGLYPKHRHEKII
jgi:hypothetical protein